MLEGLMPHDQPLTPRHVLDRMRWVHGDSEVVTRTETGWLRTSYAELGERYVRISDRAKDVKYDKKLLRERLAAGELPC